METDPSVLSFIARASEFVWGTPMLILLVGTGIFLTIRLKGLQFRGLLQSPVVSGQARAKSSFSQHRSPQEIVQSSSSHLGKRHSISTHNPITITDGPATDD